MDSQVAEHLRETQNMVHEFSRAQELLKDKVSALQLMYVVYVGIHINVSNVGHLKAVFHSIISPPPAKHFDVEIIFLHSCVAEEICSACPVVENFHLLFDLSLTARKNN